MTASATNVMLTGTMKYSLDKDLHSGAGRVFHEPGDAALCTEARLFVTADRHHRASGIARRLVSRVDDNPPRLDALTHPVRPAEAAGPDNGWQAVDCVVGDSDGLFLISESHDGEHGTKDLFTRNLVRDRNVIENNRRHIEAIRVRARCGGLISDACTFGLAGSDISENLLLVLPARHSAECGIGFERILRVEN